MCTLFYPLYIKYEFPHSIHPSVINSFVHTLFMCAWNVYFIFVHTLCWVVTAKAQARKTEIRRNYSFWQKKKSRLSAYCRKSFSQNVAYFEEEISFFIAFLASGFTANWERLWFFVANHFLKQETWSLRLVWILWKIFLNECDSVINHFSMWILWKII